MGAHGSRLPGATGPLQFLWWLPWLGLAIALWLGAWPTQQQRACWMGEWPFESGCPDVPLGSALDNPPDVYQRYLHHNPGDSRALSWLTRALWVAEDPRAAELLPRVLPLAPQHPHVLGMQADRQLQAQDWEAAAKTLVALVELGQAQARPTLLSLMVAPQTQDIVLRQLTPQSLWLDPLLAGLDRATPARALQPFVSAGQELGLLKPATVLGLIDRLKQERAWLDAYTLWVTWKGEVGEGLYNGGFDRPVSRRGFDWEWTTPPAARQAFRIDQVAAAERPGSMLELSLTGRGVLPQPVLSQTLLLPGTHYRLRGQFMTQALSAREGLVWALRCADGGERWAETAPMLETQRRWETFELTFSPPAACGAAVQLRLETAAAWEARAGIVGTVYFDDLSIQRIQAPAAAPRDGVAAPRTGAPRR